MKRLFKTSFRERGFVLAVLVLCCPAEIHAAETPDDAELACRENMQALANGLLRSMLLNDAKLPARMSELYRDGYVSDLRQFTCPASKKRLESGEQIDRETDYELIREHTDERPIPLVRERHGWHGGHAQVCYSDKTFRKVPAAVPAGPSGTTNNPTIIRQGSDTNAPLTMVTNADGTATVTLPKGVDPAAVFDALGKEHYRQGKWSEAEAAFRQAVGRDPTNAWHHFNLGLTLAQQSRHREAETAYAAAVRINPTYAPGQDQLGHACFNQAKWGEAGTAYLEAIRLDGTNASYRAHLGATYRVQGKWPMAEAAYREAARLEPGNARHHLEIGHLCAQQGKWAEAETPYRTVVTLDPKNAWAAGGVGHVLMSQGKWSDAEASYREAMRLNPGFAQFHGDLAGALLRQDRVEAARTAAQEAIRLGLKQHWVFGPLGLAP